MKPLLIVPPTHRGTCRSCGAEIEWVETVTGSKMPFDPPLRFVPQLEAAVLDDVLELDRDATMSHFATCPDAEKWRARHRAR